MEKKTAMEELIARLRVIMEDLPSGSNRALGLATAMDLASDLKQMEREQIEEAQSKGMWWGSEDKPDLAHEALERNYPEREGAFGSTWTDGYMQCMRDIENGDLKPESTQEGGTLSMPDKENEWYAEAKKLSLIACPQDEFSDRDRGLWEDGYVSFRYRNYQSQEGGTVEGEDFVRLYEWLMDDKRKPAQTFFTEGALRNVAKEFEFKLFQAGVDATNNHQ